MKQLNLFDINNDKEPPKKNLEKKINKKLFICPVCMDSKQSFYAKNLCKSCYLKHYFSTTKGKQKKQNAQQNYLKTKKGKKILKKALTKYKRKRV